MLNKEHSKKHQVKIFCYGGTIVKIYFDALSDYQIGEPGVDNIIKEALSKFSYEVE